MINEARRGRGRMHHATRRRVGATLALVGVVLAVAIGAALALAPDERLGTNGLSTADTVGPIRTGVELCYERDVIPAGTGRLRVSVWTRAATPPQLVVIVWDGDTPITRNLGRPTWGERDVVIPLRRVIPHTIRDSTFCVNAQSGPERATMMSGQRVAGATANSISTVHPHVDSLRPDAPPWWASTTLAIVAALLALTSIALGAWLLARHGE
jgi:hypothetical protein